MVIDPTSSSPDLTNTYGIDQLQLNPLDQSAAGTLPTPGSQLGSGTPVSGLFDIPADLGALLKLIERFIPDAEKALAVVSFDLIGPLFQKVGSFGHDALKVFDTGQVFLMNNWSQYLPTSGLIHELMTAGLGINTDDFDSDGAKAIRVFDDLGAFVIGLLFVSASVDMLGKIPLANRMPEGIREAIKSLPEELGVGWFLGQTLETVFEAAIGNALQGNIKRQMQLDEPEWPVIRTLIKQKIDIPFGLDLALQHSGYKKEWRDAIGKLADANLTVGDLAAMYQADIMTLDEVHGYLDRLGYDPTDKGRQSQLYIEKADTAAGSVLRSTARQLFQAELITEDQYRGYLQSTNFPARLIEDDIASVVLSHQMGRLNANVTTIKSRYLHHAIDGKEAGRELARLGYSDDAQAKTITSWDLGPSPRPKSLTTAQVLKYYVAGIISPEDARSRLIALNVTPNDVDFLLAHPTVPSTVRPHAPTPSLITQAYLAGFVTDMQLLDLYKGTGATDQAAAYYVESAIWRKQHQRGGTSGDKPLSEAQIIDAWSTGLIIEADALVRLEGLGYSSENALLLLELKNKGPITTPPAPPFPTVDAAISYLETLGVTVKAPIDPAYNYAIGVVSSYGYQLSFPTPWNPPTAPVTIPPPVGVIQAP